MERIEKTVKYSALLSIYGALLSDTQRDFSTSYFQFDLSLSEIAENNQVTRSAVEDAIKKSMKKLDEIENKLHIYENCISLKNSKDLSNDIKRILESYGIWIVNGQIIGHS